MPYKSFEALLWFYISLHDIFLWIEKEKCTHLVPFFSPLVLKALLERRFLELRDRARRLEELLPRRVSSEEQREVLGLLCKVHELEIENAEMQSHALLKDNVIRQKNYVVQRFEQHRHLCDEIIQQQKQFIDGEPISIKYLLFS